MSPLLIAQIASTQCGAVHKLRLPSRDALRGALADQSALPARRRNPQAIKRLKAADKIIAEREKRTARSNTPKRSPSKFSPDPYVQSLEAARYNPDAFQRVLEGIASNRGINRAGMVEIASRFAFHLAPSTSRKRALAAITSLHAQTEGLAAKVRSMRGKSAA